MDQELVAYLERLVHANDALAHQLDLVHQPVRDDVEVASGLRRARGDLGTELGFDPGSARRDLPAELYGDLGLQLGLELGEPAIDRFRGEVGEEFRRVDRRLLRLEARSIG